MISIRPRIAFTRSIPTLRLAAPEHKAEPMWVQGFRIKVQQLRAKVSETGGSLACSLSADIEKALALVRGIEPKGKVVKVLRLAKRLADRVVYNRSETRRAALQERFEATLKTFAADRMRPYRRHLERADKVLAEAQEIFQRVERGDTWGGVHQNVEDRIDRLLETWPDLPPV